VVTFCEREWENRLNFVRGSVSVAVNEGQIGALAYVDGSRMCHHDHVSVRIYNLKLAARCVEGCGDFAGAQARLDE